MIVGAALLVLAGLGLFVGGVVTGTTALYWACVAVCVVAAVLLVLARRPAPADDPPAPADDSPSPPHPSPPQTAADTGGPWPPAGTPGPAHPQPDLPAPPVAPDAATAHAAPAEGAGMRAPADATGTHRAPAGGARSPATDPGGALHAQPGAHSQPGAHADPAEPRRSAAPGTGEQPATTAGATAAGRGGRSRRRGAHTGSADLAQARVDGSPAEPGVEEVEVTDLLLVVDLTDDVLVVDEHPRYHLDGCRYLAGRVPVPLPLDEARTDGFTPCALCAPDRHLADRERSRRGR